MITCPVVETNNLWNHFNIILIIISVFNMLLDWCREFAKLDPCNSINAFLNYIRGKLRPTWDWTSKPRGTLHLTGTFVSCWATLSSTLILSLNCKQNSSSTLAVSIRPIYFGERGPLRLRSCFKDSRLRQSSFLQCIKYILYTNLFWEYLKIFCFCKKAILGLVLGQSLGSSLSHWLFLDNSDSLKYE